MSRDVIIVGGGIGGLSAAHELAQRDFRVHVLEATSSLGGKAKSQFVPGTGESGRRDLPGEHGFRYYPRFYKHLIATMDEIPRGDGGSVAENLIETPENAHAPAGPRAPIVFRREHLARETNDLLFRQLHFDARDATLFLLQLLQFATSCEERRDQKYEEVSWSEFLLASRCSEQFRTGQKALLRTLVAMDAERGSARTVGSIAMQIMSDMQSRDNKDRTLNGPTSIAWLEPWEQHLRRLGVRFDFGVRVRKILVEGDRISGVQLDDGRSLVGHDYVLAVPLEAACSLIDPALGALDPALARLRVLNPEDMTEWMTGLQFFLRRPLRSIRGHVCYTDSPWALTSVAQAQFWEGDFASCYGDGSVQDVISVDLSDWNTPGVLHHKPAKECSRSEIVEEVWEQLKRGLNSRGSVLLADADLHSVHVDQNIVFGQDKILNQAPLLVHPPKSRAERPPAVTQIENFFLAADYVRTDTDLATMEGANEAGRRAVNGILERAGRADFARLWPLSESKWLRPLRAVDQRLFACGLPHSLELVRAAEVAQLLTQGAPERTRETYRSLKKEGRALLAHFRGATLRSR